MAYSVVLKYIDGVDDEVSGGQIEDLHEAVRLAERELDFVMYDMSDFCDAVVINEQNGLEVWRSDDPPELKAYNSYSYEEWNTIEQGHHGRSDKPSVYFDIDGTLGKWYVDGRGFTYEEIINPQNHYFRDIEPCELMIRLAEQLQEDGVDVCIISAADKNTIRDKWDWIDEHLPFIPKENVCFSPIGADKSGFVKGNAEISVLIDDYNNNLEAWKGTAIKAINGINSHQDRFAEIDLTAAGEADVLLDKAAQKIENAAATFTAEVPRTQSENQLIKNQLIADGLCKEDAELAADAITELRRKKRCQGIEL